MKVIRYKIIHAQKIILTQWVGDNSLEDVIQFLRTLCADPEYNPNYNALNDIRQLTTLFEPKHSETILLEANRIKRDVNIKSASVVSSDVQFGIGRMYEVFHERGNIEYRVFRDLKQACDFLDVDNELIERELQMMS